MGSWDPLIRALGFLFACIWRPLTISALAFLVVFVPLGSCGFSRLCDFTRCLDRSGYPNVDRFPGGLQAHDLVCLPVELLQRFALILLEFVPEWGFSGHTPEITAIRTSFSCGL